MGEGRATSSGLSVFGVAFGILVGSIILIGPTRAAPDDADQVVLVEPAGRWHVRIPGQADYTFWYGVPGDVPLLGDWDGDGWDTPGMYRPTNGFAYLTNDLPPDGGVGFGDPALTFFFGNPGDQVFVGDWDSNGTDTLGINRNGRMFLANTNATVVADRDYWFGVRTDTAFGGDADGNGEDSVFLFRSSTGFVYYNLVNPGDSGGVSATAGEFFFGNPNDRLVIGDWDGDGDDSAGVFRPSEGMIYLRNTLNTGPSDVAYPWGEPSWHPVAGQVNLPTPPTTTTTTTLPSREIIVSPVGTDQENGVELRAAAALVASQNPTAELPWTIRIEPGTYDVNGNEVGLTIPDHTSVIGAGPDQVTIRWATAGPDVAAIRVNDGSLKSLRVHVSSSFTGLAIEAGDGAVLDDVHVDSETERSGRGVSAEGDVVIRNSTIDVDDNRHAEGLQVNALATVSVEDSTFNIVGSFTGATAINNMGSIEIINSVIRADDGGANGSCLGVSSTGPALVIAGTTVEACTGAETYVGNAGTGVKAPAGSITDSIIRATYATVDGSGPIVIEGTLLDGAPVIGDQVTCSNVTDGDGVFYANTCPGQPGILHNSFGANDDFHTGGQKSVTTPDQGNPPADNDLAEGFEIPAGPNHTFETIEVALSFYSGANELDVYLLGDRIPAVPNSAGITHEPDDTNVLEHWRISGQVATDPPGPDHILRIESVVHPLLEVGKRYWVMLSVPEPNSRIAWWSSSLEYGGPSFHAERNSSLDFLWRVAEFTDGGGLSLRVTATAT